MAADHDKTPKPDPGLRAIRKVHLIVLIVCMVMSNIVTNLITPFIKINNTYQQAKADIYGEINRVQEQNLNTFAKKEDIKDLYGEIHQINGNILKLSTDTAEIKGYLFHRNSHTGP